MIVSLALASLRGQAVLLFCVLAALLPACSFYPTGSRAADTLAKDEPVILYTLDPAHGVIDDGNLFHEFRILGQAPITDPAERTALLGAFEEGIRNAPATSNLCFNPRHGLRVGTGPATADYVICFECKSVRRYNPGARFPISTSPRDIFNQIAAAHGLTVDGITN